MSSVINVVMVVYLVVFILVGAYLSTRSYVKTRELPLVLLFCLLWPALFAYSFFGGFDD